MEWCQAFDILEEGIAFISKEGVLLKVNPTFCEITGYAEEELKDRSIKSITHPDDCVEIESYLSVASGKIGPLNLIKRVVTKDNEFTWVRSVTHRVNNDFLFHQIIPIKDVTRDQIKKVDNQVVVKKQVPMNTFLKDLWAKHGWKIINVAWVSILTIVGWIYSASVRLQANQDRLDRLERMIENAVNKNAVSSGNPPIKKLTVSK